MVWREPSLILRFNRVHQNCHESIFSIPKSWPTPPSNLYDLQPFSLTHHLFDSKLSSMEKSLENCRSVSLESFRVNKCDDHDDNNNDSPSSKVTELRRAVSSTRPKLQRHEDKIQEEEKGEDGEVEKDDDFVRISEEFDLFRNEILKNEENPPYIPDRFKKFMVVVEEKIKKWDSSEDTINWCQTPGEGALLLEDLDKVCKLNEALSKFSNQPNYSSFLDRTGIVLQQAMSFLEEQFRSLLEDSSIENVDSGSQTRNSFGSSQDDRGSTPTPAGHEVSFPTYPPEILSQLAGITKAMIAAGYETECCQVYSISRRHFFDEIMKKLGVEKISIDDVQKMQWDDVEGEITKWIKAFKKCLNVLFIGESKLCESVYSDYPEVSKGLFSNLARGVLIQLLNFAEAVAMRKRSTEKLFKFLDMYETLRVQDSKQETLFSKEIYQEISSAKSRIGGAVVGTFADFVNSIQGDAAKQPVPGGAVHPITRYVMNYLKYACAYKDTLEQLYQEEHDKKVKNREKENRPESDAQDESSGEPGNVQQQKEDSSPFSTHEKDRSPFSIHLMTIMDLLYSNIESKSKLYKDLSLSYIFLMNNGRYIAQKIKGSEIHEVLGDSWYRQKSSDLRQYHKNYQRETWSKVLGYLKDEGLQVKGSVSKTVLKERFKSFNAMFEEIHRIQSSWVVSDDQLQSELRVSISAVVIPAYRSFLGRFKQHLEGGRQSEKYLKYAPEDLETYIDELFEGTPASTVRRKT